MSTSEDMSFSDLPFPICNLGSKLLLVFLFSRSAINIYTDPKLCTTQASTSKGEEDSNQPAWAPLRDSYMLTNSKLKDWDKMAVRCPIFILLFVSLNFFIGL